MQSWAGKSGQPEDPQLKEKTAKVLAEAQMMGHVPNRIHLLVDLADDMAKREHGRGFGELKDPQVMKQVWTTARQKEMEYFVRAKRLREAHGF